MIHFDADVADRAAAQRAVRVTTDPPVEGAFYWIGDRDLRWRLRHFWTPGTKVAVDMRDYGRDLGAGRYGRSDVHVDFEVGPAMVFTADDRTNRVVATYRGQVVRDMPTSMGTPGTPTPHGTYLVGERYRSIVMDSRIFGVPLTAPAGYRIPVEFATQISYGGIYLHSAPWSLDQQGHSDVSHGCLNLIPADAEWVARHAKRGDLVLVENTPGPLLSGVEGLGDWNIPWAIWEKGDA